MSFGHISSFKLLLTHLELSMHGFLGRGWGVDCPGHGNFSTSLTSCPGHSIFIPRNQAGQAIVSGHLPFSIHKKILGRYCEILMAIQWEFLLKICQPRCLIWMLI